MAIVNPELSDVRSPRPLRLWGGLLHRDTWLITFHLLLDLPIGIVTFTLIVTGLSLSLGLAVTVLLAVPVLWATFAVSRAMGRIERSRSEVLLGAPIRPPHSVANTGTWITRLRRQATSSQTWREIVYHLLLLPVGCMTYALAVVVWSVPLLLVVCPAIVPLMPRDEAVIAGWHLRSGLPTLAAFAAGVIGFGLVPVAIRSLGAARTPLGRLLGPSRDGVLEARVETLETSRSALVDAVDAERRRIERDLHDGAQQRLVSVAMDLGMVKSKLDAASGVSPEVRELIEGAHMEAKQAITDLREVARGVHPAILEDRGLDAALSSIAARCPVPVRLSVAVDPRPSRPTEAAAYYVVAEALTNVAKHASASKAAVTVQRAGDRLVIEVTDDGRGGALIGAPGGLGGGLAGLHDRVAAIDGWLRVISPVGGPTTILAELPCGL